YLDATMMGMGRGAGNCMLEALLGFLKNPRYRLVYVLRFVETQMLALKEQGLTWGYDVPYLLTGMLNQHPRTAIDKMKANDTRYAKYYTELWDREH
ncbi:MAG: nucleoid-structuring protein H-NS, partial [Clostridia bacterium]|nr:nucleoid-structuring protein H-NS [Clostridia bacterium]